jgi:hypothetical protein
LDQTASFQGGTPARAERLAGRVGSPRTQPSTAGRFTVLPFGPGQYLKLVLACVALLFAINCIAAYLDGNATGAVKLLSRAFLLEAERSFPTMFNFGLILVNVVLLSLNAQQAFATMGRWRWHWLCLSLIFMYLAYDEAARIHERLSEVGAYFVAAEGIFRFSWIVPVVPVVALVGFAFLRFVLNQPGDIRALMILSGATFLAGAVGMEMVAGVYITSNDAYGSFSYLIIAGIEETLEMIGMALFGYTLIRRLNQRTEHPLPAASS